MATIRTNASSSKPRPTFSMWPLRIRSVNRVGT
jgi:hypothetical protein